MARILTALSGGVDSAAAAALLVEQGHEVVAAYMKNWVNESITGCYNEIAVLAAKLNALADDVATDKELADAVAAQQQELEKAKEEMTEALYAAIADAIKNNGIISNQTVAPLYKFYCRFALAYTAFTKYKNTFTIHFY